MTEFEKVRRDLSSDFAEAGRALLDYMTAPGMGPDAALAAIPGTELYVIAGTLGGIAQMLPKVGAPTVAGLESLDKYTPTEIANRPWSNRTFYEVADVERWAASHAGASAVPGQIPPDVRRALDRMCTPLDGSRLSGATAEEDARCMRIIKQHIDGVATPSTAAVRATALEEAACECERMVMFHGGRTKAPVHNDVWTAAAAIRALINTPAADGGNGGEG